MSHFTNGLLETLPKLRVMSLRQGILELKKVWEETFHEGRASGPLNCREQLALPRSRAKMVVKEQ